MMSQEKQGKGFGLGWKIVAPDTPQEQFNKAGETAGFSSYIAFSRVIRSGFVLICNGHLVSELSPQISALLGGPATPVDSSE